jgi:hypothetical protein
MKKNLLLASLMVSVMGFSPLFAVEDEDVNVKVEQCISCGCDDSDEDKQCVSCNCGHADEEATKKALSCGKCDTGSGEEEIKESLSTEEEVVNKFISCEKCGSLSCDDEEVKESLIG